MGRSEFSRSAAAAASLPVDCARSDDSNGAAEIIPADASERPRGARPIAKASFAAGVRFARGLLPQDELLPSHVVVALGLWFSELASAVDLSGLPVWSLSSSCSIACGLL
jgi:hypothetical protein